MLRIFKHFWPSIYLYRNWCALTIITMIVGTCIEATYPLLLREVIKLITQGPETSAAVKQLFFYIAGLSVLKFALWRIFDLGIVQFQSNTIADLDKRSMAAIQRQSVEFFANSFSGSLVKKASQFSNAFEGMADIALFQYGKNITMILYIVTCFALEQGLMAIILVVWILSFLGVNYGLARWKYQLDVKQSESNATVSGYLADNITNQAVVKNWGMEHHEQKQFTMHLGENFMHRTKAWFANNAMIAVQSTLMIAVELLILWLLIRGWEQGTVSVADFVFFNTYMAWLFGELWGFGNSLRRWFALSSDAQEMCEIFELHTEVPQVIDAPLLQVKSGQVDFKHVTFYYPSESEQPPDRSALHDLNVRIQPGESIGLVGTSGSGKTTLVKLLMRYYDVTTGGIFIDGQDIRTVNTQSVRQSVSLVPQEAEMFHRTLFNNIRCGKPNASEAEVITAAKRAHAWEFIQQLPNKLQTIVGERGVKLSGGQRQRIALARAFLVNAPLLVLDEATSALDSVTEQHIQAAIADLLVNRTSLVVAHRLSTVKRLDRIIVLENGKIIEQGSHATLIQKGGTYATLWETQTSDAND